MFARQRPFIRVKIKSLAEESKIIKDEMSRVSKQLKRAQVDETRGRLQLQLISLDMHRRLKVRHAARHSLLVYALLRGKPYKMLEEKCHEPPSLNSIAKEAQRFGGSHDDIEKWVAEAKAHLLQQKHPEWMLNN